MDNPDDRSRLLADSELADRGRELAWESRRMKEEEVEAQAQKLLSKLDEYSNIIPKITPQREFIHAAFVGIPKGIKGLPGQRVALHFVVDAEFRDEALSVLDSTDIPVKIIIQKWNGEKVE